VVISRNQFKGRQIIKETKRNPVTRNQDFLMDNGVATDNVIDTTKGHNTGSKLPDNVTFNNSYTT
jgi:hypothetical protein